MSTEKPSTPDALYEFIVTTFDTRVPRTAVCPGHQAPWDYVWESYHDDRDCVVWSCRGGGKTYFAALSTVIRAFFQPGCEQVILGGSQDQSERVGQHIRDLVARLPEGESDDSRRRRMVLANGSVIHILAQSETSVRGVHADKIRCDEVELFDPEVWRAVWFCTTGRTARRGSLEALSTAHVKGGVMEQLIHRSGERSYPGKLFTWCLWDVIEPCPPERRCQECILAEDCHGPAATPAAIASQQGRARRGCGFFHIDDAIAIKARSSRLAWDAEMLCRGAQRSEWLVYGEFDPAKHVARADDLAYRREWPLYRAIDFGYRDPLVCLWMQVTHDGVVHVLDEYVREHLPIVQHAAAILRHDGVVTGIPHCSDRSRSLVEITYVDPAGKQKESTSGSACTELLAAAGIPCACRSSTVGEGLELIRAALAPAVGASRLKIHPRCAKLIEAFNTYHYAPPGSINPDSPIKDGPDHVLDALRYFFINRFRPRMAVQVKPY